MISIDFTTTAMARPEIIDRTYSSFSKNLIGLNMKESRLFINIDPLPVDIDRNEVVKVAKKYFKEVHVNMPPIANFTKAVNWCWSNAKTDLIFHLEDDWELTQKISVPKMIQHFKDLPNLMEVALRAYNYSYKSLPLSPCIIHKRYYKKVAGRLNETINPEIQLRGKKFKIKMPVLSGGVPRDGKLVMYSNDIVIKDIGRKWMNQSKYKKPTGKKGHFITWEKK